MSKSFFTLAALSLFVTFVGPQVHAETTDPQTEYSRIISEVIVSSPVGTFSNAQHKVIEVNASTPTFSLPGNKILHIEEKASSVNRKFLSYQFFLTSQDKNHAPLVFSTWDSATSSGGIINSNVIVAGFGGLLNLRSYGNKIFVLQASYSAPNAQKIVTYQILPQPSTVAIILKSVIQSTNGGATWERVDF